MKKLAISHLRQQEKVNAYFQSQTSYWKDIYATDNVLSVVYRERHATAFDWIDSLALAPGSRVLEIGCGAGFMAIALAQRGFHVHAIDSTEAMIEQARQHAAEFKIEDTLFLDVGEAYSLSFEDVSFDLVVALGVIPWLNEPELALQEMARVTRSGGHVIFSTDNRARLIYLLDPWLNPSLNRLRKSIKTILVHLRLSHPSLDTTLAALHDYHFIDKTLTSVGLVKTRSMTMGFSPFSFHHRSILPESLSTALHHWLQRLADRGVPGFRSTGAQYLVLARKSSS